MATHRVKITQICRVERVCIIDVETPETESWASAVERAQAEDMAPQYDDPRWMDFVDLQNEAAAMATDVDERAAVVGLEVVRKVRDHLQHHMAVGRITQAQVLEWLHDAGAKYPTAAQTARYNFETPHSADRGIEIDDKPLFSRTDEQDGGVWVSAWLWIAGDEEPAAGEQTGAGAAP
jgi:hypothetical protein